MPRTLAVLATALVLALAWSAGALAAISGTPEFTLAPFTKAQAGPGNAVGLTMNWNPPTFLANGASDHQEIWTTQLPLGSPQKSAVAKDARTATNLFVSNGQPLRIQVLACEQASCVSGSVNTAETSHDTMIDATPPTGSVTIDNGAVATNERNVTLNFDATDPLIEGRPGTSSGVSQFAVDQDGDGSYPCDAMIINGPPPDTSGCARAFATTGTATLSAGDGVKTVGVQFGDGARVSTAPCNVIFCVITLGNPILGNASAPVTDTILLDTVKPTAAVTQDRLQVDRGGSVAFDASTSNDATSATPSGIDPGATRWDFKDGGPIASGIRATHTFGSVGTFVGEVRVRDNAGNLSDARRFSITVTPKPGETVDGGGSIAGVTGSAAFSLSRVKVTARYRKSRLVGTMRLTGLASQPGRLRTEIRLLRGPKVLARRSTTLTAAAFTKVVKLPASLVPGSYRVAFVGPGGTLRTTLRLTAPREGVVGSASLRRAGGPTARFVFAAQPVRALRSRLTVVWTIDGHRLAVLPASAGRIVTSTLPGPVGGGPLVATLKAGSRSVASAGPR